MAGFDAKDLRRRRQGAFRLRQSRAPRRLDAECDTSATRVMWQYRSEARIPVEVRVPCDLALLTSSADLPKSVYDEGEELFGSTDSEQLLKTLSMSAQAPFSLLTMQLPRVQLGPSMTRYNRVEGLSTGFQIGR